MSQIQNKIFSDLEYFFCDMLIDESIFDDETTEKSNFH